MNYKHLLLFFSLIFLFNSCDDDTDCCVLPEEETGFASGFFVLNEGNFGSANSSVSFISNDLENVESKIFNKVNDSDLGDTAQSMELHDDMAIIVVNVSNKVEIVDRASFERLATIDQNLNNPRFAEVFGKKLYVTNWGDGMDATDDFVAVFDLTDFSFIKAIPVSEGPEKLIEAQGKIYVAHKGGFSFNNKISVIQTGSDEVQTEIEVGDVPNSMVLDGENLWVLAGGKPSYAETETAGKLTSIDVNTDEVIAEFDFSETSTHPDNLKLEIGRAYLTINSSLYSYSVASGEVTEEYSLEEPAVLYGFEIHDGRIYVASPNADFTGDGSLYIYDLSSGDLVTQFSTGINPNGIYFN